MAFLDSQHPLSPFYRIEIKNEAQARIYNRFLMAKIAVQLVLLALLLYVCGWSFQMLAIAFGIAAVWKGSEFLYKRYQARTNV